MRNQYNQQQETNQDQHRGLQDFMQSEHKVCEVNRNSFELKDLEKSDINTQSLKLINEKLNNIDKIYFPRQEYEVQRNDIRTKKNQREDQKKEDQLYLDNFSRFRNKSVETNQKQQRFSVKFSKNPMCSLREKTPNSQTRQNMLYKFSFEEEQKKTLKLYEKQINALQLINENFESELQHLQKENENLKKENEFLQNKSFEFLSKLENQNYIGNTQQNQQIIYKEREQLNESYQVLQNAFQKREEELKDLELKIEKLQSFNQTLQLQNEKQQKEIDSFKRNNEQLQKDNESQKKRMRTLSPISQDHNKPHSLLCSKQQKYKYDQLEKDLDQLKQEKRTLQRKYENQLKQSQKIEQELNQLKEKFTQQQQTIQQMTDHNNQVQIQFDQQQQTLNNQFDFFKKRVENDQTEEIDYDQPYEYDQFQMEQIFSSKIAIQLYEENQKLKKSLIKLQQDVNFEKEQKQLVLDMNENMQKEFVKLNQQKYCEIIKSKQNLADIINIVFEEGEPEIMENIEKKLLNRKQTIDIQKLNSIEQNI